MIRVLAMLAIAGFVLSVASLSAAVAIGGPEAITRGGWSAASRHWEGDWDWSWDDDDRDHRRFGPAATRTLTWSGAQRLHIGLPADVRYVQAPGPGSVTVTGPGRAVDEVVIRGETIRYDRRRGHWRPRLSVVVRAPDISAFDLSGRSSLAIEGYQQDKLSIDVSGAGEVTASGDAREVALDLSGSGEVDLSRLKVRGADVEISGAADAIIAPSEWARLDISGMGDVRLLTHPARLETDISGSGKVRQEGPGADSRGSPPSPPPTPQLPKTKT